MLTLPLGIGASTAVFRVVDQTILRPAPFLHADRLVDVMHIHHMRGGGGNSLTPHPVSFAAVTLLLLAVALVPAGFLRGTR